MTREPEGSARLREAFAARSASATPADHPAAEDIYAAATSVPTFSQERRLEVIDHVGRCASCAEAWRLALAVGDDGAMATARRTPIRSAAVATLALAASLALAIGLWLQQEDVPGSLDTPVYRAPEAVAMQSQTEAALPRQDFELRWTAHPLADSYVLQVTDGGLVPLFRLEDLTEPRARIPAAALADLRPGDQVLWRVEAQLEEGGTVASETFATTIR